MEQRLTAMQPQKKLRDVNKDEKKELYKYFVKWTVVGSDAVSVACLPESWPVDNR